MFRVYCEHTLGDLRASIDDCMRAIESKRRAGDFGATYRIDYTERDGYAGYTVWRKFVVGGMNPTDWVGANKRIADAGWNGYDKFTIEVV